MSAFKLNLHVASTADDLLNCKTRPCCCSSDIEALRGAFAGDGFLVFPDAIHLGVVSDLQSKLDDVLRGNFETGRAPDKAPILDEAERIDPLGLPPTANRKKGRVLQIINVHKSDRGFRQIATSPELGRLVSKLAGWQQGARLAQDQVWAKPPGAPPLVFHRDSPYFMFEPDDVVTVWVALDDMMEDLGPLEYARGSHKWGDQRVGSASSFFQAENKKLLYSAAKLEGIEDPKTSLEIISLSGLGAGSISVHHGKTWHGSGKNKTKHLPRRGLGLHFVPRQVRFTSDAAKSRLWNRYDSVNDEDFPVVG